MHKVQALNSKDLSETLRNKMLPEYHSQANLVDRHLLTRAIWLVTRTRTSKYFGDDGWPGRDLD